MKFWGYVDPYTTDLLQLKEVSFQATPDELQALANFLLDTAKEMEKHGDSFGHEHFRDYCKKKKIRQPYEPPDLIIC